MLPNARLMSRLHLLASLALLSCFIQSAAAQQGGVLSDPSHRLGPVTVAAAQVRPHPRRIALPNKGVRGFEEQALPNIIFILADDLGYGDVGCFNPESRIPTPHLNRLAAEGMRLTDAPTKAPASRCRASSSAWSSRWAHRDCWEACSTASVRWTRSRTPRLPGCWCSCRSWPPTCRHIGRPESTRW